jgi:hypothetical protein
MEDVVITDAPPYNHEATDTYEAMGFESAKQARYLAIDAETEINEYLRAGHRFSESVEYIENRIKGDWRQRRQFVAAYLELMRIMKEASDAGRDIRNH